MSEKLKSVKPKDKLERKKYFCAFASVCSGKSKTMEEAVEKCKSKHPEWT